MKEKTKDSSYWIHMAITIVIMVGFGYLPAPAPGHTVWNAGIGYFYWYGIWLEYG